MNTIKNKKSQNKLNILSNPKFILGSIINPIIPFNNYNDNEDISNKNKETKPIDVFFGSIIDIEKPPSPIKNLSNNLSNNLSSNSEINDSLEKSKEEQNQDIKNINNINNKQFKQFSQIYPPINDNDNQNGNQNGNINNFPSSKTNSIFTNTEIKDKVEKLSENELCEIFKIIKNNNEKYSTNKNGIFINISTLKKITISELCNFINFCENNDKFFNQEEQTRDIYRDIIMDL
jgi:hypothetical protein